MEANQQTEQQTIYVIPSKKIQINQLNHELLTDFIKCTNQEDEKQKERFQKILTLKLQGNSYSKGVCQYIGKVLARQDNHIQKLDINDIFVARLKEQIPLSIQYIAKGLINSPLKVLDISNNAVNPFGAKALLNYLEKADKLEVLLIANCGLGTLGAAQIAKGLKGTPSLKTLSVGRNRMQNAGILHIAEHIQFVPQLEQIYVYQNTLKKQGLSKLFQNLRKHCKKLRAFDLCDNFVRQQATVELAQLILQAKQLRQLNLSDCLNEDENQRVIEALEKTQNKKFEKLGFNFVELTSEMARKLLALAKQYPLKRLDIIGNDFSKNVKKQYNEVFEGKGILSKFQDDDDQDTVRLMEQLKI